MRTFALLAASAIAWAIVVPSAAAESSIQYYGGAEPKYDKKIEKAAIEIAAGKIGDLRGSIEGINRQDILFGKRTGDDFELVSSVSAIQ